MCNTQKKTMPQCCAFGCYNHQNSGKRFFKVPSGRGNEQRRKIWVHRIGRANWTPNAYSRLCEDHFTPDQFENHRADGLRKLKPNALPTIFIHRPHPKSRKPPEQRNLNHDKRSPKHSQVPSKQLNRTDLLHPTVKNKVETEETLEILEEKMDAQTYSSSADKFQGDQFAFTTNDATVQCSLMTDVQQRIEELERKLNIAQKGKANALKALKAIKIKSALSSTRTSLNI